MLSMKQSDTETTKPKRKRRKIKVWNFIFLLFFIFLLSTVGFTLYAVMGVINTTPEIDPTKIGELLDESTFVYDYEGNLIEKVAHQDGYRVVASTDEIPKVLKQAIVAIEDERFYEHKGVDFKRLFGAVWYNLRTRSLGQGASTITMQLAKNLYTSFEKSYKRKIQDAYYAIEIEKQLSKDEILLAYMNVADFSRNVKGVQAAANTFFNKDVSELTLGESALLAGVPRRPVYYSPYKTEEITADDDVGTLQILTILSTKEPYQPTEQDISNYYKAYSFGKIDRFMLSQLKKGDYYMRKAVLNPHAKERQVVVLDKMLELGYITEAEKQEALNEEIHIKIGKRKASGISSYFTDVLKNEVIKSFVADGRTQEEAEELFYQGGLRIYSTLNMDVQKKLEKTVNNPENFPGSYIDKEGIVQPQVSMVIMRPNTGEIRALVGGRGIGGNEIYNRAINPRSPGSSIKPLAVYAPALENGMTAATVFKDSPRYDKEKGKMWPKNSTGYMGQTVMRNLLIRSSNVGAVEVGTSIIAGSKEASIREMIRYLKDFGITSVVTRDQNPAHHDEVESLALGGMSHGISPLEMTAAYGAIANEGTYIKPVFFTRIEDSNGKVLLENKPVTRKVMNPANAFILKHMLYGVVNSQSPRGTGLPAKLSNMTTAGKTGTTNDKKDAWFVGITPYYTSALWIGSDMPKELNEGSIMAARLWKLVMEDVHKGLENVGFKKPSNVVEVKVSSVTGLLSNRGYTEVFRAGTEPQEYSSESIVTEEDAMYDEDGNLIELNPEENSNQTQDPPETETIPAPLQPQAPEPEQPEPPSSDSEPDSPLF